MPRPLLLLVVVASCATVALWLPALGGAAVPGHGRTWELVTSADTNGTFLLGGRAWSADGDRVAFTGYGPLPGASGGDFQGQAVAVRTPQGWTVTPLANRYTIPGLDFIYPQSLAVSPDLLTSLWASPMPLLPGAPSEPMVGVYLRRPDGTLEVLGSGGERNAGFTMIDASKDLQHVVFHSQGQLLPADAGRVSGGGAYELFGTTLRLVGVDDAGATLPCGAVIGNGSADPTQRLHPISGDGRRIFFSAPPACDVPQHVYVRDDGARTTDISTSRCTRPDCNAPQDVTFAGATPDGTQALLVTGQQLTDDDTDEGQDLYQRRLSDGALSRLSKGPPGVAANVNPSWFRAADDGQRVYFLATGALVPGHGEEGRLNLYLSDHGDLRFVATVDDLDRGTAEITPDGGTFVFMTAAALLPSDLDANLDVYRYDAASGALTEVSRGEAGQGNAPLDATLPQPTVGTFPGQPMRSLSDNGRVLFATSEALLPDDHNETPDVYERASGTLGLITSGTDTATGNTYAGVSADGRSVFFITEQSLLPADSNRGDPDLYAARLDGGFPEPAPPAQRCTDDACQGPPAVRAGRPSPESLGAEADGAPAPPGVSPFGLRTPSAKVRRQLAATGRAQLVVDVPAAGRLALVARARTTGARKAIIVGRANATLRRAGTARLTLRLSRAALRTLKEKGALTLTLSVRHSTLGPAPSLQVKLSRPAARSRARTAR